MGALCSPEQQGHSDAREGRGQDPAQREGPGWRLTLAVGPGLPTISPLLHVELSVLSVMLSTPGKGVRRRAA